MADPRRRGAQPFATGEIGDADVRSPQARGSTGGGHVLACQRRPIPAGAGLNRELEGVALDWAADPRRRGAQPETRFQKGQKPHPIPAGAGLNRIPSACLCHWWPDPRRRGAQPSEMGSLQQQIDRSPQARGSTGVEPGLVHAAEPIPAGAGLNRFQPVLHQPHQRPIPAGAGLNRWSRHRPGRYRTDPRRRGAQPLWALSATTPSVRSPQARGSTAMLMYRDPTAIPIPAGAGLNRRRSASRSHQ